MTGLNPGTLYYFKVAAVADDMAGVYAEVSATTDSVDAGTGNGALINITTLGQLDAIRHDLDGDGLPTSAGLSTYNTAFGTNAVADADDGDVTENDGYLATLDGSPTYTGYELLASLDFNDADGSGSGTTASVWAAPSAPNQANSPVAGGWLPIGDDSTGGNDSRFTAVFEGNGHTLSNLYIDRSVQYVGLFGILGVGAAVRNVGIEGGSVTTTSSGNGYAGGLVGWNDRGTISGCYATGAVDAQETTPEPAAWWGGIVAQ